MSTTVTRGSENSEPSNHVYAAALSQTAATDQQAPHPRPLNDSSYLSIPSPFKTPVRSSIGSTPSELSLNELHHDHTLLPTTISDMENNAPVHRPSRFESALSSFWTRNYGVLLVLCAMLFASAMNIATRVLETPGPHGKPMHPYQILFVRQSITATCCCAYGFWSKSIPDFPLGPRSVRWLLVVRGLSGFVGVFGMYFSLLYLPLSEATVLTFLAPMLTCYACSFLNKNEPFTKQQQLACFVSLVGVVFIAQPSSLFKSLVASSEDDRPVSNSTSTAAAPESAPAQGPIAATPHQHAVATGIAMIGVVGATFAYIAIRSIGTRAHAFVSVNYFSVWCTVVSLFCLVVIPDVSFRLPGNLLEWSLLLMLGACGFTMQWMLTAGLAYGGTMDAPKDENSDAVWANSGGRPADCDSIPDKRSSSINLPTISTSIAEASTSSSTNLRPAGLLSEAHHPTTSILRDRSRSRSPNPQAPKQQPDSPRHQYLPHPSINISKHSTKPSTTPFKSSSEKVDIKTGSQTRATSMVYTQMLFALLGDKVVFNVTPTATSWIGSGLILAGALWVANANVENTDSDADKKKKDTLTNDRWRQDEGETEEALGLLRGMEDRDLGPVERREEQLLHPHTPYIGLGPGEVVEMQDLALVRQWSHQSV